MPTKPRLLAALTLCCILILHAVPFVSGLKCRCRRTTSTPVSNRFIRKVEFMPAGGHCRQDEIIVTKKNGVKVCVDPGAKWLKDFINRKRLMHNTSSSTTVTPTA